MNRTVFFLSLLMILPSCLPNLKTFFQHKKPGTIVLLNGTSSAGKTAIMRELHKIYGNSYEIVIGDEWLETYQGPILESASRDVQQQQVLTALFSYVKQLSNEGKNVFVDAVEFDDHYEDYCALLDCNSMIKILVYCPLDVIVERVSMRNKSGQVKEERPLNLSFGQFRNIYKLQQSPDEVVVDRPATNSLLQALQVAKEEVRVLMQQSGVKPEDFEKNIELFARPFIDQFKLNILTQIVLVPKHPWDLIVNTGFDSPAQAAHIIAEYLEKRI